MVKKHQCKFLRNFANILETFEVFFNNKHSTACLRKLDKDLKYMYM